MRKKTTSEIICQNFKIPHQTIFQDYKCTYKSSVTFFGRLYIGEEHFLFNSNMFGVVKKCNIIINSILKIEESVDSSIITIIEKVNDGEAEYVFGNFKKNNAFKLMKAIWTGEKIGKDAFKPDVDEETEQYNKSQQVDPKLLIDDGQVEANFFSVENVETQKQKIVDLVLPCSIQQYYDFFLSDQATLYNRKKHLELRKSREIKVTEWKKSDELQSEVRQISAYLKVKGVPFKSEAPMNQVWMLKRSQETILINVVSQMSDIPYANYFNLEQEIKITKVGQKKCSMSVLGGIVFNKSTYMKNTILSRTFGDLKQQYEFWIKNTNNFLDQIRKKIQQGEDKNNRKSSDMEYEQSKINTKKNLLDDNNKPTEKSNHRKLIFNFTMQDKINAIFVLLVTILVINIWQLMMT